MSVPTSVTGKITSRVMNMKFMKFANNVDESNSSEIPTVGRTQEEAKRTSKKYVNASEWRLEKKNYVPSAQNSAVKGKLIKIKKNPIVVSNIGVAGLQQLKTYEPSSSSIIRGRRVIGEPAVEHGKRKADGDNESGDEDESINKELQEDGYEPDMDQLFKSSKNNGSKKNKKKTKKVKRT